MADKTFGVGDQSTSRFLLGGAGIAYKTRKEHGPASAAGSRREDISRKATGYRLSGKDSFSLLENFTTGPLTKLYADGGQLDVSESVQETSWYRRDGGGGPGGSGATTYSQSREYGRNYTANFARDEETFKNLVEGEVEYRSVFVNSFFD